MYNTMIQFIRKVYRNSQYMLTHYIHKVVEPSQNQLFKHFTIPNWNPIPVNNHSFFPEPPKPRQLLIYFLSLWICLFWTFHINGTLKYVAFCVWFFSRRTIFLRFICGVDVPVINSFLWLHNILLCGYIPYFVYMFIIFLNI